VQWRVSLFIFGIAVVLLAKFLFGDGAERSYGGLLWQCCWGGELYCRGGAANFSFLVMVLNFPSSNGLEQHCDGVVGIPMGLLGQRSNGGLLRWSDRHSFFINSTNIFLEMNYLFQQLNYIFYTSYLSVRQNA
jgi:hypothetical protein